MLHTLYIKEFFALHIIACRLAPTSSFTRRRQHLNHPPVHSTSNEHSAVLVGLSIEFVEHNLPPVIHKTTLMISTGGDGEP